ncbi:MAG: arylsulfotransferase family protein [Haloferacaceae archaeon]
MERWSALALASLLVAAAVAPALAAGQPAADPAPFEGDPVYVGVQGVGSYSTDGYVGRVAEDAVTWRESSADTYFDVTPLANDTVLATFTENDAENCGPYEPPCARTGYRIVDPDGPRILTEWSMPVRTHTNSEIHDAEPLPGGGVLVADMDRERVLIVRNGTVAWSWNASTRYDAPADPTRTDWLHINDVDRIGEGRFLVSVRNANQILVLDRENGVVEVINEDPNGGDQIRGDPSVIHRQHNPQWLGNGAVLVADSENHRVVELHRGDDGSWTPAWVLTGAGGVAFDWPRDADRLPDGTTMITDTRNARVVVVDEQGRLLARHRFGYRTLPYEADIAAGEPVGGPRYGVQSTATSDGSGDTATPVGPRADTPRAVPLLTPALRLLSAAVRLPRWVAEGHLLAALLGVVLGGAAVVVRLWRRRPGDS